MFLQGEKVVNPAQKKVIDGELFEKLVVFGAMNLKTHLKTVNDLNVFPIPDGDTGDNMFMTLNGGLSGLKSVKENSIAKKSEALANGMLLNARGNSGVILSQLFYGLANGLENLDTADLHTFGNALKKGVEQSYTAVMHPVEGTMLTVARESAEYVLLHSEEYACAQEFFNEFVLEMHRSLEHTPELLEVLKQADVVDSGGAGLLYIAQGMLNAVEGKELLESDGIVSNAKEIDFSKFNETSQMKYGYCTELLLQLQNSKVDAKAFDIAPIVEFLESIGDSVVAFKTGTVVKIHVHTLFPYKVLEFCQRFGEYLTVKIENMTLQHNGLEQKENVKQKKKREHKKYGLVTVATGKGLIDTFYELGADVVIDGGQGNNPSIECFLTAFDEVDADHIFVLPNNGNIIMSAKQASELYVNSQIHVIETKNFGQAYSILSMLDYSADDPEIICANMQKDMANVVTGMITKAIRSTCLDGVEIKEGDYIGFTDKTMQVASATKIDALKTFCDKLCLQERGFLIAVYGKDVTEQERKAVKEFVSKKFSALEFYELDGGQDIYDFILILE